MNTKELHELFLRSSGICTDTRKIFKDCLFFALKGDNFNGNKFASDALKQGAIASIIDERQYAENENTIVVNDVLSSLQKLATYHRKQLNIPILSLTGSNGKTTTKELIHAVLSKKLNTIATKGNLNNHIGVPLTLLSMNAETEHGIVEMGANHLKEIESLSNIAQPNFGYITNFGKAHLEGFGSLEGVVKGKTELYQFLRNNNGIIFVNAEDEKQLTHSEGMKRTTFGPMNSDYPIELLDASEKVILKFDNLTVKSHLIGAYNFHNIAAAIAIGQYFKVPNEAIKQAIEDYIPAMNRSQILEQNGNKIILDAYNANPTSMMAAIKNFQQAAGRNKVLILGDMFELGKDAETEHQIVASYLNNNPFGIAFLVGKNFKKTETTSETIQHFETFEDFKKHLQKNSITKSYLLIKGSRGMALERTLEFI